jgi:hypothetical protein
VLSVETLPSGMLEYSRMKDWRWRL